MEYEIDGVIHMAIELMLCALVIGVIVICTSMGNGLYYNKVRADDSIQYISSKTDLYYYDNKTVTGSDTMEAMLTYTRDFDYIFEFYDTAGNLISKREVSHADAAVKIKENADAGLPLLDYWTDKRFKDAVKGYEKAKFTATLYTDASKNSILGLLFTYREG